MSRAVRFLALVAVTASLASAAAARADEATRSRLGNGLTVIVNESHSAPLVAVSLFVRVGARWETSDDAGISALLQQVLVRGTTRRSALDIAVAAEDLGGTIGTASDADFSEIRGTALGRHWRSLLELIADVALHPSLPDDGLEGERRQLLRAIRNRQDQPYGLAVDTLMARLYGAHPYGIPPLGRADAIERMTRADLWTHYQRYYRADRMVLSVSGDVAAPDVVSEAAKLFGEVRPADDERDVSVPAPPGTGDRLTVSHRSAQAHIVMGVVAPPIRHEDYAAVKVLATALGGGMGGRLFTELRDKQGLAYSTAAIYPSRVGPSYLLMQIGTAPANAAQAEEGMTHEIARIRDEGVADGELDRAKMYLLGQFALDRRTNARLAWYAAFFELSGVGYDFAPRYVRAVERVTPADIRRVAARYLGSPVIVSLGPQAR